MATRWRRRNQSRFHANTRSRRYFRLRLTLGSNSWRSRAVCVGWSGSWTCALETVKKPCAIGTTCLSTCATESRAGFTSVRSTRYWNWTLLSSRSPDPWRLYIRVSPCVTACVTSPSQSEPSCWAIKERSPPFPSTTTKFCGKRAIWQTRASASPWVSCTCRSTGLW